jgi:hypothetical protein
VDKVLKDESVDLVNWQPFIKKVHSSGNAQSNLAQFLATLHVNFVLGWSGAGGDYFFWRFIVLLREFGIDLQEENQWFSTDKLVPNWREFASWRQKLQGKMYNYRVGGEIPVKCNNIYVITFY